MPRPAAGTQLDFPRRLKRKPVSGTIVILLQLSETGEVVNVELENSDLPDFDQVVLGQVAEWRFTPPTKDGQPVKAQAKLPIPIRIN
jgi:TonB family protein